MPTTRRVLKHALPLLLLTAAAQRRTRARSRLASGTTLLTYWTWQYARYRAHGRRETAREYELMATTTAEAYRRHYNERVPTIEEEFTLWGRYHQHRHEMRYDLVAEQVRARLHPGGVVLDVGAGSGLVADRLLDVPARYIGLDYGSRHIDYTKKKFEGLGNRLRIGVVGGNAEGLPIADATVDVVVLSEVIEHLVRPELAVWEIARVLRPGGWLVLTTNNASQLPLLPPTTNPLAWLEKALGAHHEGLISHRPWVWPYPVDAELLPADSPSVYLPHTWHIQAQTKRMLATAGLTVTHFSTFEFPPPESATARILEARGALGRRIVDVIELVMRNTPLVGRLGTHLLLVAQRTSEPAARQPPAGVWPGPFSAPVPVTSSR